ncbi:MAG: dickkopf-related protein [Myxococcota bacterium]
MKGNKLVAGAALTLVFSCALPERPERIHEAELEIITDPDDVIQGLDNRGCGVDGPLTCPNGEMWRSDGTCVPALTDGDVCPGPGNGEQDAICLSENGTPNAASCVPEGGNWVCRDIHPWDPLAAGRGLLSPCNPWNLSPRCPINMECRKMPSGALQNHYVATYGTDHFCDLRQMQDELCGPGLPSCAHGYDCRDGRCRRRCEANNDCPCTQKAGVWDQRYTCFDSTGSGRSHCRFCETEVGKPCGSATTFETECCEDDLECSPSGKCCRKEGFACESSSECCQGTACLSSGVCEPCRQIDDACEVDSDCCSGNRCNDEGFCELDCDDGDPCDSGESGICGPGRWECFDNTKNCKPIIEVGSKPEVCDGLDNDCDGQEDEDIQPAQFNLPQNCNATETDGGCVNFTPDKGKPVCEKAQEKCVAFAGEHYCNTGGNFVGLGNCGNLPGQSCTKDGDGNERHGDCIPHSLCSANLTCTNWLTDPVCNINGNPPVFNCWLPSQTNTCGTFTNIPNGWPNPN